VLEFNTMSKISPEVQGQEAESGHERLGKTTAIAPANIALIKYWESFKGNIPYSDTISFNLSECYTTTTVSWKKHLVEDELIFDGRKVTDDKLERAKKELKNLSALWA